MDNGAAVPNVAVMLPDGMPASLRALGTPLTIYFYPKDDTAGCTREAQEFSRLAPDFAAAGVRVIGISKDPPASHAKFAAKHGLTVELVSDESGEACEAFGVWGGSSSTAGPIWGSSGRPFCSGPMGGWRTPGARCASPAMRRRC